MSMDVLSLPSIVTKVFDTVTSCALLLMETAAQLSLGQTLFRLADRFLWIIEKSTQWSLPNHEIVAEENGKSFGSMELVRPLPWIFFLPALLFIRVIRFCLGIGSMIIGYPHIEPSTMVKFLQKARRRLRAIKSNGMKNMRQRRIIPQAESETNVSDAKWSSSQLLRTIQSTLSSLSCLDAASKSSPSPPPTRIHIRIMNTAVPTPEEQSTTESAIYHDDSKRKYSELTSSEDHLSEDSEEETFQAKLERLAVASDSMDEDYKQEELSDAEGSSSSDASMSSSISATELHHIQVESDLICQRISAVKEAISEEAEPNTDSNRRTGEDANSELLRVESASGNTDDYYSPYKIGEDGETAFYSPISTASPSPDRMGSELDEQGQNSCTEEPNEQRNACHNGALNANVEPEISHVTSGSNEKKTTNGHAEVQRTVNANISTKSGKSQPRGRRANHSSRKRK